jgi:hypothetical protein
MIEPGELATTQKAIAVIGSATTSTGTGGGRVRHPPGEARTEGLCHLGQLWRPGLRSGRSRASSRFMDERSRTFKVEAQASPNGRPRLFPNLTAEASIVLQHQGERPAHSRELCGRWMRSCSPVKGHYAHPVKLGATRYGNVWKCLGHRRQHHALQALISDATALSIALTLLRAKLRQSIMAAVGVMFSITMFVTLLGFMNGLNHLLDGLILNRTPHVRLYNELKVLAHTTDRSGPSHGTNTDRWILQLHPLREAEGRIAAPAQRPAIMDALEKDPIACWPYRQAWWPRCSSTWAPRT